MRVETAAEQLLFSTLRIEAQSRVGTGAIVSHQWGEDKQAPFLITNKHVVEGTAEGRITFTLRDESNDEDRPLLGKSHSINFSDAGWSWIGHPDPDIDIAVLPLGPALNFIHDRGVNVFFKSIPTDLIPDSTAIEELDAVEEVLFIGYPSGIYDSTNNLPITRKGITATAVSVDYDSKPIFLIDASVFPGSSGSPVFLYNVGAWTARQGPVRAGRRLLFIGILSRVYQRAESGVLGFEEVPAELKPVIRTTQMIDLGIVYKARTIVEAIEHVLRQRGELPLEGTSGSGSA